MEWFSDILKAYMQGEIITVKTGEFEGPLELLLHLVEKRKLYISDISLASVAEDFIRFVEEHREYPMGKTAHFLYIASTLLLIKSKSLLPILELTDEEQTQVDDLERRLKLYQIFRDLSGTLRNIYLKAPLYQTPGISVEEPTFAPHKSITLESLHSASTTLLASLPKDEVKQPTASVRSVVSLEEMIERLSERITRTMSTSFRTFSGYEKAERVEIVVSFLAVLELVKRGIISVRQERHFDDIALESSSVSTPHYR